MRPSPRFLNHVLAASVCAAALLPTLAVAASYQHRVILRGLVVSGAGQALEGLSVALATSPLPDAIVGVPYSGNLNQLLTVTGDAAYNGGGITWGVVSNSLPTGLYLTADGYIGGTPTEAGTGDVQVRASYKTKSGEQTYQVVSIPLMVTLASAALPNATVGSPYNYDFKTLVSSNDQAFTGAKASFSATGLPAGLSLDHTGVLSGAPTVKNEASASFQVVSSYKGTDGTQVYTIVVNGAVLQVKQIAANNVNTCAVTVSDGVKCWGRGSFGQLGDGTTMAKQPTPVNVVGLTSGVSAVVVGYHHACALVSGGVKCWGYNANGQLGNGGLINQSTPVNVTGLSGEVSALTAGSQHTCALLKTGGVQCWGYNISGALGDGTLVRKLNPVNVSGLTSGVTHISAGADFTCAVHNGAAKCWGYNYYGSVGDGTRSEKSYPTQVSGLTAGIFSIAAGDAHACAMMTSGGLKCWGQGTQGQLGNNGYTYSLNPVNVVGLDAGVSRVSAGSSHTCALMNTGYLKCWGYNHYGQLGYTGAAQIQATPVAVAEVSGGIALATGGRHTCALTTTGGVKCWGADDYGQLGNDAALVNQPTPVNVAP